jgi:hypothetical protein
MDKDPYSCMFVTIVVLLSVQTFLMAIPIGTAGTIYINHRKAFNAVRTSDIIHQMNTLSGVPLENMTTHANSAANKADKLMERVKMITGDYEENRGIFNDLHKLINKSFYPLQDVHDMLNPKTRNHIKRILFKVSKLVGKLSDNDLQKILMLTDRIAVQAVKGLSNHNLNKTMHVMEEADLALAKFDLLISKLL